MGEWAGVGTGGWRGSRCREAVRAARRGSGAEAGGAIAVASCELRVHASVSVRSAVCAIFSLPINLQAPVGHDPLASVLRLCHCLQLGRLSVSLARTHETRLTLRVSCGLPVVTVRRWQDDTSPRSDIKGHTYPYWYV